MIIAQTLANNELKANNFREFRKNFDKYYDKDLDHEKTHHIY